MIDTSYMGDSTYEKMRYMTDKLNYWTKKYDEGNPEVSDKEWDDMYFTLFDFETTMDFAYEDSPTRKVNDQVVNQLDKVKHNHKMLSLAKTKSIDDVKKFIVDEDFVQKLKNGEESRCINCNQCFEIFKTKHKRCVLRNDTIHQFEINFN